MATLPQEVLEAASRDERRTRAMEAAAEGMKAFAFAAVGACGAIERLAIVAARLAEAAEAEAMAAKKGGKS